MNKILFPLLFIFVSHVVNAQQQRNWIKPLSCDTWGKAAWLPFDQVKTESGYYSITDEQYLNYDKDDKVSFVLDHNMSVYKYINNIQVIRWEIKDHTKSYSIQVMNVYDEIIFKDYANHCGIIIFPDSLFDSQETSTYLAASVKSDDGERMYSRVESFQLTPEGHNERMKVLEELKSCPDVFCKINVLVTRGKIWDAISLLEIEKTRDPGNLSLNKTYWYLASKLRYSQAQYRATER